MFICELILSLRYLVWEYVLLEFIMILKNFFLEENSFDELYIFLMLRS